MAITRVKVNVRLLDDWRSERKISISEFCKMVEITRCAYYQYIKGTSPSEEIRNRISYVTNINCDKLFTRVMDVQRGRTPVKKMMPVDATWHQDSTQGVSNEV